MIITVFILINISIKVTCQGDYEDLRGNQTTQNPFQTSQSPFQTTQSPFQTTQSPFQTTQNQFQTTQSPFQTTQSPFYNRTSQSPFYNRTSESFSVPNNPVTGSGTSQTPTSTRGQSSSVTSRPGSFSSVVTETAPYSSTTWPSTTWPSTTWPSTHPETSTQTRPSSPFSTDPEGSYTSSRTTYIPPNSVAEEWTVSKSPPYTTVISTSPTPTFRPESTPPTRGVTFATNPPPTTEGFEPGKGPRGGSQPPTTEGFEPGKGPRGGSQGDEGTILYDSIDHWLTEFYFKLSEQRSNIYNTRIESDFDNNKYRAKVRAESLLRIISVNYENAKRFVIARQDVHSVNSLRQQESRFCQYGYTYWPLSTRTLKCGTGYLMGSCCTIESRSCFSAPPDSVFKDARHGTDQVEFPSENEY